MTQATRRVIVPLLLAVLNFAALSGDASASFASAGTKHAVPTASNAYDVDYAKFAWLGSDAPTPLAVDRIVISLDDQRLYAYHGQQLLAWSNVSTGRAGHETPTGSFSVSQKDVDHHSSLYDDASMPFFMRLTDNGVGLHAGFLPGYPASHGCVRLPLGMARELFQRVDPGTPVTIIPSAWNRDVAGGAAVTNGVHLAQD